MKIHKIFQFNAIENIKNRMLFDEEDLSNMEGIEYLREKIFSTLFIVILFFALPLYFFGALMFVKEGMIFGAIVQMVLIVLDITLLKFNVFRENTRKIITLAILYLTGILLLVLTGSAGAGMSLVLFSMVFVGFIVDKTYSIKMIITNILIFIMLTVLLYLGYFDSTLMESYKPTWIINIAVVQFAGIVSLFLMNLILDGFKKQVDIIKGVNKKIIQSEEKHKAMIANISDVIMIVDENWIVKYVSSNIYEFYGWKPEELLNNSILNKFYYKDSEYLIENYKIIFEKHGAKKTFEIRYKCKNGSIKDVEVTGVNLFNDLSINGILINYHDITENKIREEKIIYLNNHDSLTGLYNRALFESGKNKIDKQSNLPISVISADIDGLKKTNDSLGHLEGDKLIRQVAQILNYNCRKTDIIARVGGDEFYILLPNTSKESANNIINRINIKCEEFNNTSDKIYYISISIGLGIKTNMEKSIEDILKIADDNMYKKKALNKSSLDKNIIASLKKTLFKRMQNLEGECKRIVELSGKTGKVMGLSKDSLKQLEYFAVLKDIGKITVDNQTLANCVDINEKDWIETNGHCEAGYRIAMAIPELNSISDSILTQYENWDGSGYPEGLSGKDIPLFSRITAVAMAYYNLLKNDAIDNGLTQENISESLNSMAGSKLDPEIVKIFIENMLYVSVEHKCLVAEKIQKKSYKKRNVSLF